MSVEYPPATPNHVPIQRIHEFPWGKLAVTQQLHDQGLQVSDALPSNISLNSLSPEQQQVNAVDERGIRQARAICGPLNILLLAPGERFQAYDLKLVFDYQARLRVAAPPNDYGAGPLREAHIAALGHTIREQVPRLLGRIKVQEVLQEHRRDVRKAEAVMGVALGGVMLLGACGNVPELVAAVGIGGGLLYAAAEGWLRVVRGNPVEKATAKQQVEAAELLCQQAALDFVRIHQERPSNEWN